jgi:citrate synthase
MSQIPAMKEFLPGMYMHHEMVNGKGYPQGLTGDQIPLQAKIISVADTFDAMTIDRPYSKGMELDAALERLRSFVGTRYEGYVVEALIEACSAGEVGNGIIRQLAAIRSAQHDESTETAESESSLEPAVPVAAAAIDSSRTPKNQSLSKAQSAENARSQSSANDDEEEDLLTLIA